MPKVMDFKDLFGEAHSPFGEAHSPTLKMLGIKYGYKLSVHIYVRIKQFAPIIKTNL